MAPPYVVHAFGDDIDTDVIISAKRMASSDARDFGRYCMETLDPDFAARVRPGDVVLAGNNFGCGSSREHAPLAFRELKVQCVIARSFSRIFYRNAFNVGLPLLICPSAVEAARSGDPIEVSLSSGRIVLNGAIHQAEPIPDFMQEILDSGGLLRHLQQARAKRGDPER